MSRFLPRRHAAGLQGTLPLRRKGRRPPPRVDAGVQYGSVTSVWFEVAERAPKQKHQYGAGRHGPAWAVQYRLVQRWVKHLERGYWQLSAEIRRRLPATGRRRMRIVRSYRSVPLDPVVNLPSVAKPIEDALKQLRWIVDDSEEWLEGTVEQVQDSRPWTRLELYLSEAPR